MHSSRIKTASRRSSSNSSRSGQTGRSKTPSANWRVLRIDADHPAAFARRWLTRDSVRARGPDSLGSDLDSRHPRRLWERQSRPIRPASVSQARPALAFMFTAFGIVGGVLLFPQVLRPTTSSGARMEGILMALPGWGPAALSLALQRFCVALRMCIEAGLRAKTIHYCFRATSNSSFSSREDHPRHREERSRTTEALLASGAPFRKSFASR